MHPAAQHPEAARRGTRAPFLSIATGTVAGSCLALGLILGAEPSATGMPALDAAHFVVPPTHVEESASDEAAAALASVLRPGPETEETTAPLVRRLEIGRGDTLMAMLVKAGTERTQAHAAIQALSAVQDPRRLRPGQEITLTFETDPDGARHLIDVNLDADVERFVVAHRDDDGGFRAESVDKPLVRDEAGASGRIDDNLYAAAEAAGVPARVIVELIRLYSFDVDFQRDIQPGDGFRLLYEVLRDDEGQAVKAEDILYAELRTGGKTLRLYRFVHADGEVGYYNEKGESVRKALLKTPVDGARLSSRFGKRRHPILGYTRMHRGLDFAAPSGTPIMAAGDGRIEEAGWKGGYGRYVRIRHNGEFKTAYAHMSRFARGIHVGARVRQGEIIGYVGTTGRSTGPHLHYEVLKGGTQINPMGLKLPTGRTLAGAEKDAFQKLARTLDARYAALAERAEARLAAHRD